MAFTTMSSLSAIKRLQMRSVRGASPRPPLAATLRGTVLTRAALRHQRSFDFAHLTMVASAMRPSRHAGPDR